MHCRSDRQHLLHVFSCQGTLHLQGGLSGNRMSHRSHLAQARCLRLVKRCYGGKQAASYAGWCTLLSKTGGCAALMAAAMTACRELCTSRSGP